MDDYNDIIEFLKPRRDIKASDNLRKKVRKACASYSRRRIVKKWLFGGISIGVVAAICMLTLIPSGISAKEVLRDAIDALDDSKSMKMIIEVRTRPIENFRYINVNDDFVTHHIYIADSDSLLRWRINKGERIAVGNGGDIYAWMPSLNLGWHIENADKDNILGYLANFLTPKRILELELESCIKGNEADYQVEKKGKNIYLTIHASPHGNFNNPYVLNTSITESESIRRYIIDAESKRLKSAKVSVIANNREIEVLKVSSIYYVSRDKDICVLPNEVRFVEIEDRPNGLIGLSAEEAASTVLNAFADWDESILDKVIIREVYNAAYRKKFQGSKLISIGCSFKSGTGDNVFVPYTLRLQNGSLQRHNIALQKTEYDGWIVVGGL